MTLPAELERQVKITLRSKIGDSSPIKSIQPVTGGCINHASRLQTGNTSYLLKWNQNALPGMFKKEAQGLELLRSTHTVRVPEVLFTHEQSSECPQAFILLEYINEPPNRSEKWIPAVFGNQLAALHQSSQPPHTLGFGLDEANYLGSTIQPNGWHSDWLAFFREKRLEYQISLAARNGRLAQSRRRKLDALCGNLEKWLGSTPHTPALLHGDLWSGNVLGDEKSNPVLIDPAVYYGDREAEIAYTQLFGGFPKSFYEAYYAVSPFPPGFETRCDLYNLYHLLNHLNLFGESYGSHIDVVLRYYVG
jgi:fructosamine-3-kinase